MKNTNPDINLPNLSITHFIGEYTSKFSN